MLVSAGGIERGVALPGVFAQDTDALLRVRTDKPVAGSAQTVMLVTRRVSGGDFTALSPEAAAPGLTHDPKVWYWVRAQTAGANPSTIRIKAWRDGEPEPAGWQYAVADSEAILQGPGGAGLKSYLAANTTNAPVTFAFDDYVLRGIGG